MMHTRLNSPYKKGYERRPNEFHYSMVNVSYLPKPEEDYEKNFFRVLKSRSSRREWGSLSVKTLSFLLWYVAKTKTTSKEKSGFIWQHRHVPSGGGRHPIDLIVIRNIKNGPTVDLYDPYGHALVRINVANHKKLNLLLKKVNNILPFNEGALIWFVAQFDRTMSKYANGECLVWLDAGAILATIYLVAEAFHLNCCAVGITGEPWVSDFLSSNYLAEGVCGCLIGSRPRVNL